MATTHSDRQRVSLHSAAPEDRPQLRAGLPRSRAPHLSDHFVGDRLPGTALFCRVCRPLRFDRISTA